MSAASAAPAAFTPSVTVTPTTPSGGATPFPEGDPRNAKYFENLAALEHTLNNTLASDQQDRTDALSAYNYSTGELGQQLPLSLQATRNTANAHGLLESGQLAQAAGGVEAKYAAQRGKLISGQQSEENKLNENETSAKEAFNLGRSKAATAALEEGKTELEKEGPDEQAAPSAAAAAPAASAAPTGVGQKAQRPTSSQSRSAGRAPARTSAVPRVVGQQAQPATVSRSSVRRQAAKRVVVG
jgi:hypothetical protein